MQPQPNSELKSTERHIGSATVTYRRDDGAFSLIQLTLSDGRIVYFNHRTANLHDEAGRPLAVGDRIGLFAAHRLPKGVLCGTRVLFRSDAWWAGPPPP